MGGEVVIVEVAWGVLDAGTVGLAVIESVVAVGIDLAQPFPINKRDMAIPTSSLVDMSVGSFHNTQA